MSPRRTETARTDDRPPRRQRPTIASGSAASSRNMPATILRAPTRTAARDWAKHRSSTSAAAPTLNHVFGYVLRGAIGAVTEPKGTEGVAPPPVHGTLRGQP